MKTVAAAGGLLVALAYGLTLESMTTASLPATCVNGRLVWDSTVGKVKVCQSNKWIEATPGVYCGTGRVLTYADGGFSCVTAHPDCPNGLVATWVDGGAEWTCTDYISYSGYAPYAGQLTPAPGGCDAGGRMVGISTTGNAICNGQLVQSEYDPPNLGSLGCAETEIAMTGAAPGKPCRVGLPESPDGGGAGYSFLQCTCMIHAANIVDLTCCNGGVGAFNASPGTFTIIVDN